MKTKFIVISIGVFLTIAIIFIIQKQQPAETPEFKVEEKVVKTTTKEPVKTIFENPETKVEVPVKSPTIGKVPDPADKEAMEEFFNKAFIAWNDKVASLIVNDLKLGQDALDKYSKIRNDFYQSQFAIFQVHTSAEGPGNEDKESQRRLASTGNNFKNKLEENYGINFDSDQLNTKDDFRNIQKAVNDTLKNDSDQFLADHLKQVKDVLGNEGFKKYKKIKDDFNNDITEEGSEPLFKI